MLKGLREFLSILAMCATGLIVGLCVVWLFNRILG